MRNLLGFVEQRKKMEAEAPTAVNRAVSKIHCVSKKYHFNVTAV